MDGTRRGVPGGRSSIGPQLFLCLPPARDRWPAPPPGTPDPPGVTVDVDGVPGPVGGLVVQTGAVLLGHTAPAPVGHQPRGADAARHAVSAELRTDRHASAARALQRPEDISAGGAARPSCPGCGQAQPWGRRVAEPHPPTHAVHVQRVAAPEALGAGRAHRGIAAVQVHHGGHAPCGGRTRWEAARPGPPPAAGRGPSHRRPARAPQYLSSSARWLPSSSASHAHTSYERRTAGLGGCPLPRRPTWAPAGRARGLPSWSLKVRTAPAQGFAAKAPDPTNLLEDTRKGVGRQPDGVQRAGPVPGAGPVAPTVGPTLRTPSGAHLRVRLYRGPERWRGTSPQEATLCFRILQGGTGGR